MTEHRPKTAALIAYAGGLLSPEGRRRVDGHLAACELCREELAAIDMYESLIDDVRISQMPEIDFESMELPLAREAEALSRQMQVQKQRRSMAPWAAVALAAAAGLAFWAWPRAGEETVAEQTPVEQAETPDTPAPVIVAEPAVLTPVVTLLAGRAGVMYGDAAEDELLELGASLREGAVTATGEDSELHVRLSDGTGVRLAAATTVELERAREDEVRLELRAGALSNHVAPLSNGSSFVVLCADYEVEVTGTRFVVSYLEDVVGVDLSEGSVVIRSPAGDETRLEAPARWRSEGGVEGELEVPPVRGTADPRIAPTLVTLSDLRIVRWSLDGADISTEGDIQMGVAPGEHEVRGWDARGRLFTTLLPVGDAPVMLESDAMTPEAPRIRAGHLDPEDIRPVLTRGMRQVQRCYEVALRRGAQSSARARLRIDIGVMGDVRRARVIGLDDPALQQCIRNYAMRWTFPPPGGPLTLEQPLTLSATQ